MSMYNATVPQFIKMLSNLGAWLDEAAGCAEERGYDVAVLLDARLYPDMFTLRRQIQSCCDATKLAAARLAGVDAPVHEDGDQSLEALRARIVDVQAFLGGLDPAAFDGSATRELTPGFLRGRAVLGHHYLNEFALPNAYFHFTTAYGILRHNGVPLGKLKFVGNMTTHEPH